MANGNFFAFLAGVATGAALLLLANTEKGEEVIEDLKEKGAENGDTVRLVDFEFEYLE